MSWCGISHGLNEWGSLVTKGWLNPHHLIPVLQERAVFDCVPMIIKRIDEVACLSKTSMVTPDQVRSIVNECAPAHQRDLILDIVKDKS